MALFPTGKVLEITLDYLYNDKEVQEFVANMQSEEFPKIHKTVEYLKEYKNVSAFMYMNLKPQCAEKIFVGFKLVAELLFSSVWNTSMTLLLTFMQLSVKFMTALATLHSNRPIPHARVSV